ncbi:MAG: DUF72 domain-containing protein [Saprospiraceae bacterium]|nr:DUF72 domain-containing protein [Candidatus Vicinibacter affinis]
MKFGKESQAINKEFVLSKPRIWIESDPQSTDIFSGGTGYSNPSFRGTLYPKTCKSNEYLYYYSRLFNGIEFNGSYYKIPDDEKVFFWKSQIPEHFKFCPKFPLSISNSRNLGDPFIWQKFEKFLTLLENHRGPAFLQLPRHFDVSKKQILYQILDSKPLPYNFLIELRHESWFKDKHELEDLCAWLGHLDIGLVITDTPGRRDACHMEVCSPILLIRYLSDGNVRNDEKRINSWIEQFLNIRNVGIKEFHFYLHLPNPTQMVRYADCLRKNIEYRINE